MRPHIKAHLIPLCLNSTFVLCSRVVAIAHGQLGLRIGPCSLLIPQRGNDARCCTIRSTGTNTVLRPGESREGDGREKNTLSELHCTQYSLLRLQLHWIALPSYDLPVLQNGLPELEAWLYKILNCQPIQRRPQSSARRSKTSTKQPHGTHKDREAQRLSKTLEPELQDRRFRKSSTTVQVQDNFNFKFKTTSTKFQEHATNKHVMILSCRAIAIFLMTPWQLHYWIIVVP